MTTPRNVWDDLHDLIARRDAIRAAARKTEKAIDKFVDDILATARRRDMIYETKRSCCACCPNATGKPPPSRTLTRLRRRRPARCSHAKTPTDPRAGHPARPDRASASWRPTPGPATRAACSGSSS